MQLSMGALGVYCRTLEVLGHGLLAVVFVLLGTVAQAWAATPAPVLSPAIDSAAVDLATLPPDVDLAALMEVHADNGQQAPLPEQILALPGWKQGERAQELLAAPREFSIVWLQAVVRNTSSEPLTRWLNISPWRLNQVDAWFLDPQTQQVLATAQTGLNFSVAERSVESSRALIPITLAPGESQRLVFKITSDSRPFLTISSWNPIDFTAEKVTRYQSHAILLTVVITLLVVLLLQGRRQYLLIGVWMLVTFAFESEKEGYISFVLFGSLANYADNVRFITWMLTGAMFLVTSIYLLSLHHHRWWRWLTLVVLSVVAISSMLSFILDGVDARNLGSAIYFVFLAVWALLIPSALKQQQRYQRLFLFLLSLWWAVTGFILLGYIFNFYYTSAFASSRVVVEAIVTLGLLLVYSLQERTDKQTLEYQLRSQEKEQRERLEKAVEVRTQELRQAVGEAGKANAAKTEFLARVTHDLRSPLTSILGYTQLLLSEKGKVGEMSHTIHGSASHMLHLINRLIDYARGAGEGEMQLTDLYLFTFLNSIAQEASIAVRDNGNTFRLVMAPDLPPVVRCDGTYLRQILLNLLDNAAKHTVKGEVELYVGRSKGSHNHDVNLVFRVTDSGCGVPPEIQDRLWEAFYQPSRQRGGLGLGLSIVKQLTQQLGGALTFESAVDKGTRVCLALPVMLGREENADAAIMRLPRHILPVLDAEGLTVWVVEDSPPIREFLSLELSGLGFSVDTFNDGPAIADALLNCSTPPDLVLTDYYLPRGNGDTVLASVKRRWFDVPVILLSATQRMTVSETKYAGGGYAACLSKPVDLITLRRELAKACRRELIMPGSVLPSSVSTIPDLSEVEVTLDADEWQQLEYFLALGAVTDLVEWCQELADKYPARRTFAATLCSLAEQGDFSEIARIVRTR